MLSENCSIQFAGLELSDPYSPQYNFNKPNDISRKIDVQEFKLHTKDL